MTLLDTLEELIARYDRVAAFANGSDQYVPGLISACALLIEVRSEGKLSDAQESLLREIEQSMGVE